VQSLWLRFGLRPLRLPDQNSTGYPTRSWLDLPDGDLYALVDSFGITDQNRTKLENHCKSYFFNAACQFSTTVYGSGLLPLSADTRKRLPSATASHSVS